MSRRHLLRSSIPLSLHDTHSYSPLAMCVSLGVTQHYNLPFFSQRSSSTLRDTSIMPASICVLSMLHASLNYARSWWALSRKLESELFTQQSDIYVGIKQEIIKMRWALLAFGAEVCIKCKIFWFVCCPSLWLKMRCPKMHKRSSANNILVNFYAVVLILKAFPPYRRSPFIKQYIRQQCNARYPPPIYTTLKGCCKNQPSLVHCIRFHKANEILPIFNGSNTITNCGCTTGESLWNLFD